MGVQMNIDQYNILRLILTFIILILLIQFSLSCFEGHVHVCTAETILDWYPQGLQLEKLFFSFLFLFIHHSNSSNIHWLHFSPNYLEHNFES